MERFLPGSVKEEDIAYFEDRLVDELPRHRFSPEGFWEGVPHAKFSTHDLETLEEMAQRSSVEPNLELRNRLLMIRDIVRRIRNRVHQFMLEGEKQLASPSSGA